ncbi:MAG: restriction endonuclease subunit S [Verrucomicrobia bacterium]|nr:restriction endonuclease subunit S [Verrucomicrobiota bacterium]
MKLPAYPKTKPSGVDWLGNVPEHWEAQGVKFCYSIQLGKMLQPEPASPTDEETPYLKSQHVQWEHVRIADLPTMWTNKKERWQYAVRDGDLLVCEGGDVGRAAVVYGAPDGTIIQNALHRVRPQGKNESGFLLYVLAHAASQGWFEIICNKSTIAHFTVDKFGALGVALPTPAEQKSIAAFLDRETGRIDTLVAKKRELIERLKEKRTALISRTVTRGLDPNVALKPSGLDWLGDIPKHWDAKPLKFIALVKTGFAFSSDDFTDEGVPVLRIGDITRDGRVDFSGAKYLTEDFLRTHRSVVVQQGDITMAMTGATIGKVGRYSFETPALLNQRVCIFRPRQDNSNDFLWHLLNADFYIEHVLLKAFGGAQPNISDTQLLSCSVPVPPPKEQAAIAAYLDEETAKLDVLAGKVETAIERLQEYRTALITAAVTGKIDVRKALA